MRERLPQEANPEGLMDRMDRARSAFMRREFNANWSDHRLRPDDPFHAGIRSSGRLHRRGDTGRVATECLKAHLLKRARLIPGLLRSP